jgi:hypothetical protein
LFLSLEFLKRFLAKFWSFSVNDNSENEAKSLFVLKKTRFSTTTQIELILNKNVLKLYW